jgi:hypothetical protein
MRSSRGFAVGVGLAILAVAGSASALEIKSPRDGATVREKVQIVVPRTNIPPNGFLALYIDNEFILAQSPSTTDTRPIVFTWDTKQPRGKIGLTSEQRDFAEGEHLIEVRSYNQEGGVVERDQVNVLLNNRVPTPNHQPIRLSYKFRVEDKTTYQLRTEIEATSTGTTGGASPYPTAGGYPGAYPTAGGYSGANPGGPGGFPGSVGAFPGPGAAGDSGGGVPGLPGGAGFGPNAANQPQTYTEFRKVTVHVADDAGPLALLREFPENPVTVIANGTKQPVQVPAVSRYYFLSAQGDDRTTAAMNRQGQKPFYNIIRLPANSIRVGDEWKAKLNISLGAYIPERIEVMATNVVEAVEWELGNPAARIRSTYTWNGKLSIPSMGIVGADCKLKGVSIIHFAPATGKPVRAVHNLDGDVVVDLSRAQTAGSVGGSPGMPGIAPGAFPGAGGGPGAGYPGPAGGYSGGAGGYTGGSVLTPQKATYKAKIRATVTAQR